ncbi:nuclear transport factor 2 family protein [Pectobacterium brasiliense]|uniref:nuclear transport factor 2 family protein n=1 Tax=Pectobacterium brasiliense TaxID=180957 RepID=UPI00058391B3|nr:nuclear transport factor 2 family protein [Pectobacterium brasiliense]ARA76972.1 transcriptional regulator [Pectobacterium brasiliense]KHS81092.1 transcriptional regulator [Pectobacterium brasiliense]
MNTLSSVINRFVDYYTELDTQQPSALAAIYHPDASLIDPFGEHEGLVAIQRYFTHLLANVEQCRFSIDSPLSSGHRFSVTWIMHWAHPRVAGGEALTLHGCSIVDIQDDLIIRQRDYYDAGEMIYEHLPLLGWAVRGVKRRVRS